MQIVKLKSHVVRTTLRRGSFLELRKNSAIFREKDIAFVLREEMSARSLLQLMVITSTGGVGWIFANDVEEVE